jgi:hypothetical protein
MIRDRGPTLLALLHVALALLHSTCATILASVLAVGLVLGQLTGVYLSS